MRLMVVTLCLLATNAFAAESSWPEFRGPRGNGHAAGKLPTNWSETKNVVWKIKTDGQGWSTPVVWENQIWMTSATLDGRKMFAVSFDGKTGKEIKRINLFNVPKPQVKNKLNSYASPSPVVADGRLYAYFGTYGIACLDIKRGRVIWKRRDVKLDHQEGPGSSPVIYGRRLFLQCDGRDKQFVAVLNSSDGRMLWKNARSIDLKKVPDSLCDPHARWPANDQLGGSRLLLLQPGHREGSVAGPIQGLFGSASTRLQRQPGVRRHDFRSTANLGGSDGSQRRHYG
jgi:hypothetical protein